MEEESLAVKFHDAMDDREGWVMRVRFAGAVCG